MLGHSSHSGGREPHSGSRHLQRSPPIPPQSECYHFLGQHQHTVGVTLTRLCFSTLVQRPIEDSLFHCRVVYEDSYNPPKLRQHELEENIGIYFDDNYERISVPLPRFGSSDPADIIHDFNNVGDRAGGFFCLRSSLSRCVLMESLPQGLTAYYDIALDKCYVSDLNTTTVMPPSSLWDMLLNLQVSPPPLEVERGAASSQFQLTVQVTHASMRVLHRSGLTFLRPTSSGRRWW